MTDVSWSATAAWPDAADAELVADTTGWPATIADPSPLRWANALMSGVTAAVSDERWGIDPLSMRVTEAVVVISAPARPDLHRSSDLVWVEAHLVQVLDLGELAGLHFRVVLTDDEPACGTTLAMSSLTIAGRGPGLAGGSRPRARTSDPTPSRSGPDDPVVTHVAVSAERVGRFTTWSGDRNAFHTDPAAARAAGLPRPIAPGLYVLGLMAAAAAEVDGCGMESVHARFVRPAVVGDDLTITVHGRADGGRRAVDVEGPDGPVIRRGWVRPS